MSISLPEITRYFHEAIPLTRALGLEVASWDGTSVSLSAPLEPNHNHTDTAFGGSISSLAILAGYCLLHLTLLERNISGRILIGSTSCEFLRPIDADFAATARAPEPAVMDEFLGNLQRKRRGRLEIASEVHCHKVLSARHSGVYVAMLF